ncbi:MAG TPA: hypothetical protein VNY24_18940, partial [Candidatus Acidoferrales bacterium]|nr:hypothetical protein [Candidatus Acidoferrales bacterium]
ASPYDRTIAVAIGNGAGSQLTNIDAASNRVPNTFQPFIYSGGQYTNTTKDAQEMRSTVS